MRHILITVACLMILAAPALADSGKCYDEVGIFFDDLGYVNKFDCPHPYTRVYAHLMILRPSCPGISRWQCHAFTEGSILAETWELTSGGVDLGGEFQTGLFDVSYGYLEDALRPFDGICLLATWNAYVVDPNRTVMFFVQPLPGSTIFPDAPGYIDGKDPDLAVELSPVSGHFDLPVAYINGDFGCPGIDDANQSWGALKNLFR